MNSSSSACKHLESSDQHQSGNMSQSHNYGCSSALLSSQQSYENISPFIFRGMTGIDSVNQPNGCNFSFNFTGYSNYSIPPPFLPPVLAAAASTAHRKTNFNHFTQPCLAFTQDILTNQNSDKNNITHKGHEENENLLDNRFLLHTKKTKVRPSIQLHHFSDQLKNFHSLLMKLKNDFKNLNLINNQLDFTSWNERVASLSSQWDALQKLKQTINVNSTSLALLKYKLRKRQKKRKARRKNNLIKNKSLSKYEIAYSHMQQLRQIEDKQKQDEKFKIEADSILFSVRQKKSEASSQIQFLTALSKLHTARIHAMNMQNKNSLSDAVFGFNRIIDKLKSMWQHQMEEYLIEENGLKIMLKGLAVAAEDEDCKNLKKIFGLWLKLLFGTADIRKDSYFSDFNELIGIRRDWDKYVVTEETNSSKIPAGWVVPKYKSDDMWSRFVS